MPEWDEIADSLGFSTEREMWETLHPTLYGYAIANLIGYSTTTINARLREHGLSRKPVGRVKSSVLWWSREAIKHGFSTEREMWETLYPTTCTAELAALFNVTGQTILNRVHRAGVKMRPRGGDSTWRCSHKKNARSFAR